jgi:2-polyprenyl-3-methyl-5-hydroxy-6-metoxy-1,4-benzoquinol methylase
LESIGPRGRKTLDLLLENVSTPRADVLDYGCGTGAFAYQVAHARPEWRVTGWEGDFSASQVASRYFTQENLSFERRDYAAHRALGAERYDAISFLEVIEHVDNPGEILRSFRGALRPGGVVVISTPNILGFNALLTEALLGARLLVRRTPRRRIVEELNARSYDATTNTGHVAIYSLATLSQLLSTCGFELSTFAFSGGWWKGIRRAFPETVIVVGVKRG